MITERFKRRLSLLYSSWRTDKDLWGDSNILVISTRSQTSNLRSSQVFLWLFGQDLDDTAAVFTPYAIFFLCNQRSFSCMRNLVCCASALMKIPMSIELMPKKDEVPLKLGRIVRSVRARLISGDLNRPLTVGCVGDEILKLEFLLNGSDNYAKYRIVNVSSGVTNVISEGDHGVHGSVLADDMQYRRGIKRSINDRMAALKLTDDPLEESLGKPENPNQTALLKRFENMALVLGPRETSCEKSNDFKIPLNTLGKLEKVDKPSLVVDQVENTQPARVAETSNESFTLGKEFCKEVDDTNNTNIRDNLSGTTEEPRKFKLGWEVGAVINEKEAEQGVLKELKKKLTLFYSSWTEYRKELWGECDVLVISTPPFGSTTPHPSISSSFYQWLLGHEFPNTTAVFMDHTIDFVCPVECFTRLCSLGTTITNVAGVSVSITQKIKADAELELVDVALYALRKHQASHQPVIIGYIDGESLKSKVLDSCGTELDKQRFQTVNVISALVKLINEDDKSKSLQRQCSDVAEVELEQLAENYQQMCFLNDSNAKPATSLISNELKYDEFLKENYEHTLVIQKVEETKLVPEEVDNNLPTQFAQVNISVKEESVDLFPPIEDNRESELVVDEGKSSNAEQEVRPEKEQEYCRSNEDDDWEIIEKQHDVQEPDIASNSSWMRWMGKAFSSVAHGRLS